VTGVPVGKPRERTFALHDPERAPPALLVHEVPERTGLADLLRDVRRHLDPRLVVHDQLPGEARLLDRADDAERARHELGLAQPAGRERRAREPLRVPRALVAVDAVPDRLGAELRDRVPRVDALRAALVAEEAARAFPDPVLAAVLLEPLDRRRVARIADEAHSLRERLGAEKLRVGLHRVALRHAAAAVDAERLLVDDVHPLLRDAVLAPVLGPLVAGLQPRLHRLELVPEGIHVDDEVLDDRE